MNFWEFFDKHFWAIWWLLFFVGTSLPSAIIIHRKDKQP